jgi:hypothetical protein
MVLIVGPQHSLKDKHEACIYIRASSQFIPSAASTQSELFQNSFRQLFLILLRHLSLCCSKMGIIPRGSPGYDTNSLCTTPACINIADDILGSMATNHAKIDPCTDFDECKSLACYHSQDVR